MTRFKTFGVVIVLLAAAGAATGWVLSAPQRLDGATVAAASQGDAERGRRIFFAGGCASCHAGETAQGDDRFRLAGGAPLVTPFGSFVPPNISQHATDGIGGWSAEDFANAMLKGVSPDGRHYYPAFPYTSYARMTPGDVGDLYAFMKTLPAVEGRTAGHTLSFPFTLRRGIGLWKRLYLGHEPVVALAADAPDALRLGRYLVEGPGHCGECHTPRFFTGGPTGEWLAGAVAAEGRGNVPNITPSEQGIGSWSEGEIVEFLQSGFTPEFDSAGGSMASVVQNMASLTAEDREAIAAYLKAIPPLPNGY